MRTFSLCDEDGYVHNAMFYSTKKLLYNEKGVIFSIVFALMTSEELKSDSDPDAGTSFLDKGHVVCLFFKHVRSDCRTVSFYSKVISHHFQLYCDNLYTEIPIMVALRHRGTHYCGTARVQKSFMPKLLMAKKTKAVRHNYV